MGLLEDVVVNAKEAVNAVGKKAGQMVDIAKSVSYTHLDVYKRQVITCWALFMTCSGPFQTVLKIISPPRNPMVINPSTRRFSAKKAWRSRCRSELGKCTILQNLSLIHICDP